MPKRIQMTRQRPWRAENPDAVIVARPSKWGNPWRIEGGRVAPDEVRRWAVEPFERYLAIRREAPAGWVDLVHYPADWEIQFWLLGRDLACWCPLDQPCHGDVLLELANGGA